MCRLDHVAPIHPGIHHIQYENSTMADAPRFSTIFPHDCPMFFPRNFPTYSCQKWLGLGDPRHFRFVRVRGGSTEPNGSVTWKKGDGMSDECQQLYHPRNRKIYNSSQIESLQITPDSWQIVANPLNDVGESSCNRITSSCLCRWLQDDWRDHYDRDRNIALRSSHWN